MRLCDGNQVPKGWWCDRRLHHSGPCNPRPKWWNLLGWYWMLKTGRR
jgi:hypothetical protein